MVREERKETKPAVVPNDAFERGLFANQLGLMRRFSHELDRVFEEFGLKPRFAEPVVNEAAWAPDIEVFERQGQLVVRADLPGMTKDDVNVRIIEGVLTLRGERKQEKEITRDDYYQSERSYGAFHRTLVLPEGVKAEQVQATFKNGVLEVTMPLAMVEKTIKTIDVKVA
jgi:HSP20 family protein